MPAFQKIESPHSILRLYVDAYHYTLPSMIKTSSQELAYYMNRYHHEVDHKAEFFAFSAMQHNYWMIGIGTGNNLLNELMKYYQTIKISSRRIKTHCPDNVSLVIEYELSKMPAGRYSRHE